MVKRRHTRSLENNRRQQLTRRYTLVVTLVVFRDIKAAYSLNRKVTVSRCLLDSSGGKRGQEFCWSIGSSELVTESLVFELLYTRKWPEERCSS